MSSMATPLRLVRRTSGASTTRARPSASLSKMTSIHGSAQRGWQYCGICVRSVSALCVLEGLLCVHHMWYKQAGGMGFQHQH